MFGALGRFIYARRWLTLIASGIFLIISLALLLRGGRLTGGAFGDSEAEHAEKLIAEVTGTASNNTFVVIFRSATLEPGSAAFQSAMKAALDPLLGLAGVKSVMRVDQAPKRLAEQMINVAQKSALAMVSLDGEFKEALSRYGEIRERLHSDQLTIACTGFVPFMDNFDRALKRDLFKAELISLPLALLVLLMVFRTLVAAALPVGVGALAVVGGIAMVMGLSRVIDIAEYTVNVCSIIGLGVAIDYSLFTVSRYREELAIGRSYPDALVGALEGAGRVVCFAGVALCVGLVGLMFFHGSFLAAMGLGGAIVVLLAMTFALTFLPALLAVLGPRINALAVPIRAFGPSPGFWHKTASWVMRHPVKVLVPTLLLLLVLGIPFLHLKLTAADVRVLGIDIEAREAYERLKRDFPELGSNRIIVAVRFPTSPALTEQRIDALYDFGQRLDSLPHVTAVDSIVNADVGKEQLVAGLLHPPEGLKAQIDAAKKLLVGSNVVLFYVVVDTVPESPLSQDLVRTLRRDREVGDGEFIVGGQTAGDMDATAFVRARTPRAVAFVVAMTIVILFFLLGSIVLPIKAVVMNILSLAGSFGALVWVFQDGHLGFAEPRPIDHVLPVLLFCVLFGISMDYEVLMLSRIKEAYARTKDNTLAVAEGLEQTAGLITSAAAIMVVVFGAFALAKVVQIRAMGFGMALAVAIDATLVRTLVVPATMRLFGDTNWWAPKVLVKLRVALGLDHDHS